MKFKNIYKSAINNIVRQKFVTIAQVSVIVLVFVVLDILVAALYSVNMFSSFLETRPNLNVYFALGTKEEDIMKIKSDIEATGKVASVKYTSELEAVTMFKNYYIDTPVLGSSVQEGLAGQLPASLDVRASRLDYLKDLDSMVEKVKSEQPELIDSISYKSEIQTRLNDILTIARIIAVIVVVFLIIVLFSITFLSIEFNIRNRAEEIKVMQLVGASKWTIRFPFVLEGVLLGLIGSLIATCFIIITFYILVVYKNTSPTLGALYKFFSEIQFPDINLLVVLLFTIVQLFVGALVGGINHFLVVRRYLK